MRFTNKAIAKIKRQKFKIFIKAIKKKARFPNIKELLKRKNGKLFLYVKEIKEINDLTLVRLKGNIDLYTIPFIKTDHKFEVPNKHFLLDFKEVTHIDSATLASLLMFLTLLKIKNRKLGVINPTALLNSYLNITKSASLVKVYSNENKAIKDFREAS